MKRRDKYAVAAANFALKFASDEYCEILTDVIAAGLKAEYPLLTEGVHYERWSCGCVTVPQVVPNAGTRVWIDFCGGSLDDCQATERIP